MAVNKYYTDYSSFLNMYGLDRPIFRGMGYLVDLSGSPLDSPFLHRSDSEAIASDWLNVGKDLRYAINNF